MIRMRLEFQSLNGLNDWHLARVRFSEADRLAAELGPGHVAAVRINIARQYSVLADFIRPMNSVFPDSDRFNVGETAATNESRRLANQVIDADSHGADDATRTAAFELLARVAHRNREFTDCRRNAEQALGLHMERGSLAGAKSAHRLLGLSLLREAEMHPNDEESSLMTAAALRHFQTAYVISEALRERFPLDETGMSRAGFFARRAYVNEQIIPLLIARRQFAEALGYAEAAQGRSFKDFLALRGHLPSGVNEDQTHGQRSLPEPLANWPVNTAALEYYLGSERAWEFVIDPSGDVTAHVLTDEAGEPIQNVNAIGISEFDNAPTLPGVRKDLENFRSAFHDHPLQTLVGREADEPAVTDFLNHTGLLFVATHGMNIADQPLSSFLLCHAGGETDGRLTAAEILQHRIGARLVVLSACYSGLADRSPLPGDDLFGLQRALLQAGANCIVSGLWDVYDETGAQLMDSYFQRLKAGDKVPSALAASQREFLSRRRKEGSFDPWIHPYFWAVYIPTGSDLTHVKN